MKRTTDTSAESFDIVKRTMQARQKLAYDSVIEWKTDFGHNPSSGELTKRLKERGLIYDVNSVRPQLTMLKDLGMVKFMEKRPCTTTGRNVYTWDVTTPEERERLMHVDSTEDNSCDS